MLVKLSLQGVEEMTSLSNHTSGRVIQIKPIRTNDESPAENNEQHHLLKTEEKRKEAEAALEAAQLKRDQLLKNAENEIEELKQAWEAEKQDLQNEAYQNGFDQGVQQGEKDGYDSYIDKLKVANGIIEQAKERHDNIVKSSEETIAEIALQCSGKILHQQLEDSPEMFLPLVKKVVQDVQDQPEIVVYVHPDQYGTVHSQTEELKRLVGHKTQLTLYADEDLVPFSCLIESPFGRVDAGIDSQLTELRKKVLDFANGEIGHE